MLNKNIEIEIRGPLSKDKFNKMVAFFDANGKKMNEKKRILIDYTTSLEGGVENREKDVRLRITNGIPEIIVKLGKWGGEEQRKELSVLAETGSFDTLVEIFGELGFTKGILCERKSKVYMYQEIEFALVEVPNHSYYYEAEKMAVKTENSQKVTDDIKKVCLDLGLDIFDQKGFFKYINQLNKESNEIFEYVNHKEDYFKDRFRL